MLTNKTYFTKSDLYIPNINEPDPNNRLHAVIDNIIERCEQDVFKSVFGIKMWNDFKQWIEPNGGLKEDAPQNYKDLVYGKEYTKDDKTYYWNGIIQENPKFSFISCYVYYIYKLENITQTTDFGETSIDTKIGNKASDTPKMVSAWNKFIDGFCGGYRSGYDGLTTEGNPYWLIGDRGVDYYGHFDSEETSMIKCLDDNKEEYPLLNLDVRKIHLNHKNSWGI